jgi:predicted phage terminase large subunit-like protein
MPPRHGKSELLGRYLPAWYLGTFPDRYVIYASYSASQARHYGQLARKEFEHWSWHCFGLRLSTEARAAHRWRIEGREGGMYAVGVRGPLTGKGAHLLIIDDPIKNAEDAASLNKRDALWNWFHSTAMTRLEPGGVAIVNMTRWHEDDLVGRILASEQGSAWRSLTFPAICEEPDELGRQPGEALWPERFPLEDMVGEHGKQFGLLSMKAGYPQRVWEAMYQQHPMRQINCLWPEAYFTREDLWFDDFPQVPMMRVMTLDPALAKDLSRGDYSAFVMLAIEPEGQMWVEAELARGLQNSELVALGMRLLRRFGPRAFRIETNLWQAMLKDSFATALRQAGLDHFMPRGIVNVVSKATRIESLDSILSANMIRFRNTPGTRMLVDQLRDFPAGQHDDGPDALEMAVRTAIEIWPTEHGERPSQFSFFF